jgi:2'-deoxynucleoside 5'-phosphate N-hydrolase
VKLKKITFHQEVQIFKVRNQPNLMKIYLAASITGNNEDKKEFFEILNYIKKFAEITDENAGWNHGDNHFTAKEIHERDVKWFNEADAIIAEVTKKSLGVGYEIGRAIEQKKPVLCLYKSQSKDSLSPMIVGCPKITNITYSTLEDTKKAIKEFITQLKSTNSNSQ